MILDLLDANRIKAGEGLPVVITECQLDEIIEKLITDQNSINGDRYLFTNQAGKVTGYWDCTAVQRIIENLICNAAKYGQAGSPITVTLATHNGGVEFAVHNEGNPIAQEDIHRLFLTYHRTESALKSGHRGWGIGLALVHGLVESLKGSVRVESSLDKGTIFTVSLPMDSRPKPLI